jgi:hypothetical protein
MPKVDKKVLPGKLGHDYHFVKVGDNFYVVYSVTLPNGNAMKISWKTSRSDLKAFGLKPEQAKSMSRAAFHNVQHLGNASELQWNQSSVHPWQQYIDHLQELYGHISWLNDKQFMSTMLQGYVEGWSSAETQQALTQTKWYQKRTSTERQWLTLSKADRNAAITSTQAQMQQTLRSLFGADYKINSLLDDKQLKSLAEQIASGKFGDTQSGMQLFAQKWQRKAEREEGTPAWIAKEQGIEAQRSFMNRPEDMFEQIKQEARYWLGPAGMPTDETLKKWAKALVIQKASDADWKQFLQGRAEKLYPWMGTNTPWQEFVDPYKRAAEQTWDRPIEWDDPILRDLGASKPDGTPTGGPLSFSQYSQLLRQDDRFWTSPKANQQGAQLVNYLNNVFNGVS